MAQAAPSSSMEAEFDFPEAAAFMTLPVSPHVKLWGLVRGVDRDNNIWHHLHLDFHGSLPYVDVGNKLAWTVDVRSLEFQTQQADFKKSKGFPASCLVGKVVEGLGYADVDASVLLQVVVHSSTYRWLRPALVNGEYKGEDAKPPTLQQYGDALIAKEGCVGAKGCLATTKYKAELFSEDALTVQRQTQGKPEEATVLLVLKLPLVRCVCRLGRTVAI
jgi:hypothetical protein